MKKILLSATFVALTASVWAAPLSPEDALGRAVQAGPARVAAKNTRFELAHSAKIAGRDMIYLFKNTSDEGFLIAPADDSAPALLGYGDTKITDETGKMAPGFEYWINELARQVEYAAANKAQHKAEPRKRAERAEIEPLCKTLWNQDAPFNDLCPEDYATKMRCATGCVATAMSQVMKYHNWPEKGQGSNTYKPNNSNVQISTNFANVTFDWDNMLDVYTSDATDAQKEAVATLMVNAGYSVKMDFYPDGSEAQAVQIGYALGKYFGYDKSMQYLLREYYTLQDWEDMIYNSLATYGPVIYDGQAGLGGHSFVCDGYQGDGYFHFNWGWGGLSDGYFLLDALDPEHQGIGGANGGFDFMQDVVLGIRPDKTGDSAWNYIMYGTGATRYAYDGNYGTIRAIGTFSNYGPGVITQAHLGLSFTSLDNPDSKPYYILENNGSFAVGAGVSGGVSFPMIDLPDGKYRLTAVYSSGDEVPREVQFPIYSNAAAILTVENGKYTVVNTSSLPAQFEKISIPTEINKNSALTVTGILKNPNDTPYVCYLSALFYEKEYEYVEEFIAYSAPRPFELEPEGETEVNLSTTVLGLSAVPNGNYYLAIAQLDLPAVNVTLLAEPELVHVGNLGGLGDIVSEEMTGLVEYYDVSGIKVAELEAEAGMPRLPAGIYILRCGDVTRKVILK